MTGYPKFRVPEQTYRRDSIDPVSPEIPRQFAASLGYEYPERYVDIVSKYGGLTFHHDNRVLRTTHPEAKESGWFELRLLLHFNSDAEESGSAYVPFAYDSDDVIYRHGFIPFISTLGRTWLCFDFRSDPGNPSIVWYEGDSGDDLAEVISPVIESFDALLENLVSWDTLRAWENARDRGRDR